MLHTIAAGTRDVQQQQVIFSPMRVIMAIRTSPAN